jgi:acetyl esterase/lipase
LGSEGYATWFKALQPILEGKSSTINAAVKPSPKAASTETPVIRLWPIEMIGGEQNRLKEAFREKKNRPPLLCSIKDPNMTVYQADSVKPTPAVVYCPGGAYKVLDPRSELVEWLNEQGITVFMLKYTIPDNRDAAFNDVQRAMRMVRHQAKKWNIDPNQVGVIGQSAGGHLIARLSHNYKASTYAPIDEADQESCEPNFAMVVSGAYFLGAPDGPALTKEFHMKNSVAPTFLVYAKDDVWCQGGEAYEAGLRDAGVSTHIELYEKGGHGLGGVNWYPIGAEWLKAQGVIK